MTRWAARVGLVVLVVAICWGLWLIPNGGNHTWPNTGHPALDVLIWMSIVVGSIAAVLGGMYALAWVFAWLWEKAR